MSKKVTIPVVAMVLLLGVAPLIAGAQEDAAQPQPAGEAQTVAPDPAQQDATQYAEGAQQDALPDLAQPTLPDLSGLIRLDENNELVVDCERVSERLAQVNQLGETQANDPLFQAVLARVDDLAQLCADGGFTPPIVGEPTATPTPPIDEASGASNPSGAG